MRNAFTLAELVVSVGVLALMFALAGQIFSLTLRSTGQARAVTTIGQALREFEQTVREDLKYVQPGSSVIVIQGNPVRAYWTRAGREADDDYDGLNTQRGRGPDSGYPHPADPERDNAAGVPEWPRADVLMIFSARPTESYVKPGVTADSQAIVYGHAELGEYVSDGSGGWTWQGAGGTDPVFPVNPTTKYPVAPDDQNALSRVSPLPAEAWHLARRSVLLVPTPEKVPSPAPSGYVPWARLLNHASILNGSMDIVNGDVNGLNALGFNYQRQVLEPNASETNGGFPFFHPWVLTIPAGIPPYARSLLDVTPPAPLGVRLGHYCLPNCASFKVEWSLDPRSEFVNGRLDYDPDSSYPAGREVYWFDPGAKDPAAALRAAAKQQDGVDYRLVPDAPVGLASLLCDEALQADGNTYSLAQRVGVSGNLTGEVTPDPDWTPAADGRPNLMVFTASRPRAASGVLVPGDVFPHALRITVDVFDENNRLERPVRHVFVVPVGG
ncbi:MAG TPA: type II secretion system protein [Phycisphaerae bacterium]|nr:type II secretion system protein [Phycisphaerae bacterium]